MIVIKAFLNLLIFLVFDAVWMRLFAARFYAHQLESIGRFSEVGGFDVRLPEAIGAYVLMALALELFIFRTPWGQNLGSSLIYGGLLGLCLFGVFDLTNRAVIEHYPVTMAVVDMCWGVFLYAAAAAIGFWLRKNISFLA